MSSNEHRDERVRAYAQRMNRVLDFIAANLHRDMTLDELACVARSSKYHFHRQFCAYAGITVFKLIRLMRLKRASYQLAFNRAYKIIDVALDAGFSSPEAFARAFKNTYGQTPSEFRANPEWTTWTQQHKQYVFPESNAMQVKIIEVTATKVAALEHRGSPATLNTSVSRFIEWRKATGLSPNATSDTFGIPYGDPEQAPPDEWRFDVCGTVTADVPENPQGVITKTIPAGRCAVVEHHGSTDAVGHTVRRLYAEWHPGSGEKLRDFPCYFQYVRRMPAVSEHDQLTLVYLPLC